MSGNNERLLEFPYCICSGKKSFLYWSMKIGGVVSPVLWANSPENIEYERKFGRENCSEVLLSRTIAHLTLEQIWEGVSSIYCASCRKEISDEKRVKLKEYLFFHWDKRRTT